MPLEGAQLLAAGGIPQLHRLVPTARGQPCAIGAEGHALDFHGMSFEGAQLLATIGKTAELRIC
jgi:hypothetical protein